MNFSFACASKLTGQKISSRNNVSSDNGFNGNSHRGDNDLCLMRTSMSSSCQSVFFLDFGLHK